MDRKVLLTVTAPQSMKDALVEAAKRECRTLSKEILYRLTQYEKMVEKEATNA